MCPTTFHLAQRTAILHDTGSVIFRLIWTVLFFFFNCVFVARRRRIPSNFPTSAPRSPSEHTTGPTNPADLQDFFNRIFKGAPPTNMAANGGFFPSGPPHHQPPGAGVPPFSPSQGPTGFSMPGSHRTDSSEPWAEGGKPPRRRKKVRKPFQR